MNTAINFLCETISNDQELGKQVRKLSHIFKNKAQILNTLSEKYNCHTSFNPDTVDIVFEYWRQLPPDAASFIASFGFREKIEQDGDRDKYYYSSY